MQRTPQRAPTGIDLRKGEPRVAVCELERFRRDDGAVAQAGPVARELQSGFPDFLNGADGLVVGRY